MDSRPSIENRTQETVTQLLDSRAQSHGDEPLMRYQDEVHTYGDIIDRAERVASSLAKIGVGKGDNVGAFIYNSPEFLSLWFGVAKVGAVLVPVNISLKSDGLAYIINDSDVEHIVLGEESRENYETARDDLEGIQTEFIIGEADGDYRSFDELLEWDGEYPSVTVNPKDPLAIIYTSGTTGLPKGVVLPHYSYINTGWEFVRIVDLDEDDVTFTAAPLFHCAAQQLVVMGSMLVGTNFAMARWFSASAFWDQIREHDATIFNYIGSMIQALYNQDSKETDSENPAVYGFGAPAPDDIITDFEERFDVELIEGYGLTESGTVASFNTASNNTTRQGTVGPPSSHIEIQIVDDDGWPVEPGTKGEILIRPKYPHCIMLGYYGKPKKTVEDWQNLWLHTGDIGHMDEDGLLYFVDRKAYSIRRRGENVASMEVEQVINEHPDVEQSAVVGVPSELGEEDVKAHLLPKSGDSIKYESIISYCEDRLAYFKIPRYLEVMDEFPKTETERIKKYKLKERGVGSAWDREEAGYELNR